MHATCMAWCSVWLIHACECHTFQFISVEYLRLDCARTQRLVELRDALSREQELRSKLQLRLLGATTTIQKLRRQTTDGEGAHTTPESAQV